MSPFGCLIKTALFAQLGCVLVAVELAPPAWAAEPRVEEIKLVVHPADEPRPALKYRLLPPPNDRQPGNAALMYGRIAIMLADACPPAKMKKVLQWNKMPPVELPLDDVEAVLAECRGVLDDLELAARYEECKWQVPLRGRDPTRLLLPTIEKVRDFAELLALQVRLQTARSDLDGAIHTLQTGFAMGRHVGEGPTAGHCLTGTRVCSIMAERVRELIQHPDSPNLYWAMSALPRPLIDWRTAMENEMEFLYLSFPELRTVEDRSRPDEYWQALWQKLAGAVTSWQGLQPEFRRDSLHTAADAVGLYPVAKKELIEGGWAADEVEEMSVPQVLLIYTVRVYNEVRDDVEKWLYLPHYEDSPAKSLRRTDPAVILSREVLPLASPLSFTAVWSRSSSAGLERELAVLRTVEALRLHAAAHDGRLPASLGDTKVPIPFDPYTWQPYEYTVNQGTATLRAKRDLYQGILVTIESAK